MPEAEPWSATVVVLCRDNPGALAATLDSSLEQRLPPGAVLEVLVVDGSTDGGCAAVVNGCRQGAVWELRHRQEPPRGPYAAMNAGLELARKRWLLFLNSGDAFASPQSLAALMEQAETLAARGRPPAAVFGQAWIEPTAPAPPACRRWLSPDPGVRRIDRWLRHMAPCHQAVLFDRRWAQQHPYQSEGSVCADRVVIRQALAVTGPGAYRPEPVCRFRLDGISSSLPDLAELRRRWVDPCRRPMEKLGEVGKLLLRPFGAHYPWLMRWRARWMGWLC